jgi:hypothetical protein
MEARREQQCRIWFQLAAAAGLQVGSMPSWFCPAFALNLSMGCGASVPTPSPYELAQHTAQEAEAKYVETGDEEDEAAMGIAQKAVQDIEEARLLAERRAAEAAAPAKRKPRLISCSDVDAYAAHFKYTDQDPLTNMNHSMLEQVWKVIKDRDLLEQHVNAVRRAEAGEEAPEDREFDAAKIYAEVSVRAPTPAMFREYPYQSYQP